jgi:uncharacterized protein with GYD domain
MSTYIILANYTEQGIRTIKESPSRLDAAREMARGLGAELKDFYLTMGAHDFVTVVEAPDDEVIAKFLLALGSLGNVRTVTLKAFTETEYRQIIQDLR